jgi:hypothetical protein
MHRFLFKKLKWTEGLEQDSQFDQECGVPTAVECWRKSACIALVRAEHPQFRVRATLGSSVSCLTLLHCQPRNQLRNQIRIGESS